MKHIIFYILIFVSYLNLSAQDLYIKYDSSSDKHSKYLNAPYFSKEDNIQRNEIAYYFHYYIYYGGPIEFISKNHVNSLVINSNQLQSYDIKTFEQLEIILTGKNPLEQMQYFDNFQKIFIVEINQTTQKATITEVEIDVEIE